MDICRVFWPFRGILGGIGGGMNGLGSVAVWASPSSSSVIGLPVLLSESDADDSDI